LQRAAEIITVFRRVKLKIDVNEEKAIEIKVGMKVRRLRKDQKITQSSLQIRIGKTEQTCVSGGVLIVYSILRYDYAFLKTRLKGSKQVKV
jgi:hypothetical protein